MTPAALKFIEQNFTQFCEWFNSREMPDLAWPMVLEDFDTMKPGVEYLIEWIKAARQRTYPA